MAGNEEEWTGKGQHGCILKSVSEGLTSNLDYLAGAAQQYQQLVLMRTAQTAAVLTSWAHVRLNELPGQLEEQ